MYHFRDQIRAGNPSAFFVLNGDVCADFPLQQLHDFHMSKNKEAEVSRSSNHDETVALQLDLTNRLQWWAPKRPSYSQFITVVWLLTQKRVLLIIMWKSPVRTCPLSSIAVSTSLPLRYFLAWRPCSILGNRTSTSTLMIDSANQIQIQQLLFTFSLNGSRDQGHIQWEREIITPMAGTGKLFALPVMCCETTNGFFG